MNLKTTSSETLLTIHIQVSRIDTFDYADSIAISNNDVDLHSQRFSIRNTQVKVDYSPEECKQVVISADNSISNDSTNLYHYYISHTKYSPFYCFLEIPDYIFDHYHILSHEQPVIEGIDPGRLFVTIAFIDCILA